MSVSIFFSKCEETRQRTKHNFKKALFFKKMFGATKQRHGGRGGGWGGQSYYSLGNHSQTFAFNSFALK